MHDASTTLNPGANALRRLEHEQIVKFSRFRYDAPPNPLNKGDRFST